MTLKMSDLSRVRSDCQTSHLPRMAVISRYAILSSLAYGSFTL